MNPAVEILLSALAWLITIIRVRTVVLNRVWKSDPIAFRVWVATLFFALTLTFLVTPVSYKINSLTMPNFSRLLAYSSVSITLYLIASSFLATFPTARNLNQSKYLKPYLIVTLSLLFVIYMRFVSHTPEWNEQPIPGSAAEMVFKLVLFTFGALFCVIMASACYQYLNQEKVSVTKYRIVTIILTASAGGAYFFTKTILTLGYLWPPLSAVWIHKLSQLLEIGTAFLWAGSFLHSSVYARILAYLRGLRYWFIYQDLDYLIDSLERLCPPVGMSRSKPKLWEFMRNSDYYLYRAIVHILDGKTLIADFLADTLPIDKLRARWDDRGFLEATRLNSVLQGVNSNDDYLELISTYRLASRRLRGTTT